MRPDTPAVIVNARKLVGRDDSETIQTRAAERPSNNARELPELGDVVEPALARALVLAAEAQRWDVVQQLAAELERRSTARAAPAAAAPVVELNRKRGQR